MFIMEKRRQRGKGGYFQILERVSQGREQMAPCGSKEQKQNVVEAAAARTRITWNEAERVSGKF